MIPRLSALRKLSVDALETLEGALAANHLKRPYGALAVQQFATEAANAVAIELNGLADTGMSSPQIAIVIRALLGERKESAASALLEVVTTGPDINLTARDTAVVVQELFSSAQQRVLAVGFAVYQGTQVFRALAERLDAMAAVDAVLCLDVARPWGDTTIDDDILARFAERFAKQEWPGRRRPRVYYDPRSLCAHDGQPRTSLHAKCIVVDGEVSFVTSANFTEAAQERNIELGLLARNRCVAEQIERHFFALINKGLLRPLHFPP